MSKAVVRRHADGVVIVEALFTALSGGVSVALTGPTPEEIAAAVEHVETRVAVGDAAEKVRLFLAGGSAN